MAEVPDIVALLVNQDQLSEILHALDYKLSALQVANLSLVEYRDDYLRMDRLDLVEQIEETISENDKHIDTIQQLIDYTIKDLMGLNEEENNEQV